MATTKKRKSTKAADKTLLARTSRTIRDRPYASAAIATGAVTAVAAAAAGAFFFSRSNKSIREAADEVSSRVKDGLAEAKDKVKTTANRVSRKLDGAKSQTEIAEEALTLKETGAKSNKPAEAGAVAH